jgi:hypothetical protein
LSIHSDRGKNYEAELGVERFNKTLITLIRAYLKGKPRDWDLNLGCLAGAYRATQHDSTGYSPNHIVFGREVRMPIDILMGNNGPNDKNYGEFVSRIKTELEQAHRVVQLNLQKAALRQEENYNMSAHFKGFEVGDPVLLRNEKRFIGQNPKLQFPYEGPGVILQKYSDLNYKVQLDSKGQSKLLHFEKLKLYKAKLPTWIIAVQEKLKSLS